MNREQAEMAMKLLLSREYFFKTTEPWSLVQSKLESAIRLEGGIGLAKVASYLYVLKRKQIVATQEVIKLQDTVNRHLFKELSEAFSESSKLIEEKVIRGFRSKMTPDN
jgi:hypothetical protein